MSRNMSLSEAYGRIEHLEKELESVDDLLSVFEEKIQTIIGRIDESGQALKAKSMTKRAAGRMIMDLLPKAREIRSSANGIRERIGISLNGSSQ